MPKPHKQNQIDGSMTHSSRKSAVINLNTARKSENSLGEQAYAKIKDDIITCVFAPGESCSESQLAERYGVSKAPIRWALAALSRERLVTSRARQGYVVAPLTMKSVKGLFELRIVLESAAARLAAGLVNIEKLKSFKPRLGKYDPNDRNRKVDWIMANQEFHLEIARATGNEWLYQAILDALEETRRIIHVSLSVPEKVQAMSNDHRDIIDALARGDGERAAHFSQIHIEKSLEAVLAAMLGSNAVQEANFDGRAINSLKKR
jgi:DNA-binding GntR family transcriptional regulator